MVLDALFVAVFQWGLIGAAAATAISQFVGGVVPLIYFGCKNSSYLRLVKCKIDVPALLKACANGSSELMSNISMSLVGMLFNIQLIILKRYKIVQSKKYQAFNLTVLSIISGDHTRKNIAYSSLLLDSTILEK